ncbi:Glucose--fructose oxidoreductase [Streptomyces sp. MBT84]|uniref:Gfo/Idh/MocA family protein n=1 Tax=unclassified Streptomyces TaxID=2593676 RepID=UPI001C6E0534|nr:Gfo/Idh/MocA family oxidoreductase [Streptomyces sp. MBT84]MBW8705447.1 Glucose--fructose oxidoreductase [Streptomyces sp. MBT84]
MGSTIGVGVVGLSATGNWGAVAHWPAIEAVPGVRLQGLTAGSPKSTAAAAKRYGVPGYMSVAEMASREEIDLIAITVRVPEHRKLLEPVLESGKAVLCEWPLARDLAEAEFLRDAGRPGPRFTGLQGHVSPTTRWVRDLIADGYVGEVLSSSMICSFPGGGATFTSASAYTADAANGATMMTIPFAHALDMQAVALGELTGTTATIATLRTQAVNTDTGKAIAKTAPDQIAVTGRLPGGAVASMHFRGGAPRTTPFAWEIDGTRGSLRITGDVGLPMSAALAVEGAHDQEALSPLELPAGYDRFPGMSGTPAHNVAHLYAEVAEALSGRDSGAPGFDHAVELHRSLEAIAHRGTEE